MTSGRRRRRQPCQHQCARYRGQLYCPWSLFALSVFTRMACMTQETQQREGVESGARSSGAVLGLFPTSDRYPPQCQAHQGGFVDRVHEGGACQQARQGYAVGQGHRGLHDSLRHRVTSKGAWPARRSNGHARPRCQRSALFAQPPFTCSPRTFGGSACTCSCVCNTCYFNIQITSGSRHGDGWDAHPGSFA